MLGALTIYTLFSFPFCLSPSVPQTPSCFHIYVYMYACMGDGRGQEMTTTEDNIKGNISDEYNIFSNLGV